MDANNFCFKYFATGDKNIGMLEKDVTGWAQIQEK
jgi:hypothetical protein